MMHTQLMALSTTFLFLSLTVSEPADGKVIKGKRAVHLDSVPPTDLRRPRQPHLAQLSLPWAVVDRPHQEDAQ